MTPERLSYQDFAAKKEIAPLPGNEYEIAPGAFGRLRAPTLNVLEAYEKADEPMATLMEAVQGEDDAAARDASRRFTKVLYEVSIACAKEVLEIDHDADWSACYPQICVVVRAHFFALGWPIAGELTTYSQAQAAPETA